MALALATAFSAVSPLAIANPQGGVAIHGQVSTNSPAANKLNVITTNGAGTNHSAINWQSFSIPAGSTTNFQQPSATSLSINRVVTNTPSALFGTLSSNGRLVLVNQSGIAVGAGAVIDTAGFTASALRMSDADALAGRLRFGEAGTGSGANITIGGRIIARDGDVVLIAPNIELGGTAFLTALNGSTVLAAGQQVEITGRGLEGIKMLVQAPTDSVRNLGMLQGDAVGIFAGTLRHSGEIQATTAAMEGGQVVLKATGDAIVDGTAKILATGGASAKGGRVDVLGNHVAVMDQAVIDASGGTGGGTIRVGGDFQGKNAEVQNAFSTTLGVRTALKADATLTGEGGRVIVWADDSTVANGLIAARGASGGNAGFVETSGKRALSVTQAPLLGKGGTWLLDPTRLEIGNGSPTLGYESFMDVSTIISSLESGTSVNANALGDLDLTGSIIANVGGGATDLSLTSTSGNVTIRSSGLISLTGTAITTTLGATSGSVNFQAFGNLALGTGTLLMFSGFGINQVAGSSIGAGAVIASVTSGSVDLLGTNNQLSVLNLTGAANIVNGTNALTLSGISSFNHSVSIASNGGELTMPGTGISMGSGDLTLSSPGSTLVIPQFITAHNITLSAGNMTISGGLSATGIGNVSLTSTGDLSILGGIGATGSFSTTMSGAGNTMNVFNAVTAATTMNLNLAGGLFVTSSLGQYAGLQAGTNQTITAKYLELVSTGAFGAGVNTTGGNQTIDTTGKNASGEGLRVRSLGTSSATVSASLGAQTITVNQADYAFVGGTGLGGFAAINGGAASSQTFTMTGGGLNQLKVGDPAGQGSSSIVGVNQTITAGSGSETGGGILVRGGLVNGAGSFISSNTGVQTITTIGNLELQGGSAVGGAGSSAQIFSNAAAAQNITAHDISLTGGASGSSNGAFIQANNVAATQSITITGGGTLSLKGGDGSGTGNRATISNGGSAQNIALSSGALLHLQGGINGAGNVANIYQSNSAGSQTVTGSAADILIEGGTSGGVTSNGNRAVLESAGSQDVTVNAITVQGGNAGTENFAQIYSARTQRLTVGAGGLSLQGGGGSLTDRKNYASVFQATAGAFSQEIRVGGAGVVSLHGGNSSGFNLTDNGFGSFAVIRANGNAQLIEFTSPGGALNITGGTVGSFNLASIYAPTGTQTVQGSVPANAPSISITGGASGGIDNQGNIAGISAQAGFQTISATTLLIRGGSAGLENYASVYSNTGGQTITATGITIEGGTGGGFKDAGNSAGIRSNANQTITVGAGGINLYGGGGILDETDNEAYIYQAGIAGTNQTIFVNNTGNINITGGYSDKQNVGGSGYGSRAHIETERDQFITFNAGGDITLEGGRNGSRSFANIYAAIGSFNQTILGVTNIKIDGGNSGGVVGEGNSAGILSEGAMQTITTTGYVTLTGGVGGVDNSAYITAANQDLNFGGYLTLTGSNGGDSNSGARIGGVGGSSPSNTNLTLDVGGALTLLGSSTSGVSIGSSGSGVGLTNNIVINTVDLTMTPSFTQGMRIGSPNADIQTGSISITATGDISLNSGGGTGFAAIRSLGNVTLTANSAGKYITEAVDSILIAGQLTVSAHDGISLDSPKNQVGSLTANVLSFGDFSFTNSAGTALTIAGINQAGGDATITADDLSITGAVTGGFTTTFRTTSLARDISIATGTVANSLSLSSAELGLVSAATLVLESGNNINSISGGNIGAVGSEFNSSLILRAYNDINLTNGNIVLADDQNLIIHADYGPLAVGNGVGNVNIGGGRFQVGTIDDNTGDMTISGQNITVALSGNSTGVVYVLGSGTQTFTAANNLTFANNNTGSGALLVVADGGAQHLTATSGLLSVSAGTGTGTSAYVGTGDLSVAGQFITARGMSISGGAAGGAVVGGSTNDRNLAQVYANAEQTIVLGGGGLSLTGGGGAGNSTGNMASLLAHGDQTITVADGGHVTLQGGSSAGQNVVDNNGSLAYITSDGDQTLTFTGLDGSDDRSVILITGGSNGSGNNAGILSTGGSQIIAGSSSGFNPSIIMQGGSGGGGTQDNSVAIVSLMTQEISSANLSMTAGTGVSNNGAFIASQIQQIDVTGNLSMTGGSASASGGVRMGGLSSGGQGDTLLDLTVSGNVTLTGGLTSSAGIGSSPFQSGLNNDISITAGGDVTLNPSFNRSVAIGHLGTVLGTEAGNIVIDATGDIRLNSGGGGAGAAAIRTNGDVFLTTQSDGEIFGASSSTVVANRLTISSSGDTSLTGSGNIVLNLQGSSTGGDFVFSSNSSNGLSVGAVSGNLVNIQNTLGSIDISGFVNATNDLLFTAGGTIAQSAGSIYSGGVSRFTAGGSMAITAPLNQFNVVGFTTPGNVDFVDQDSVGITTSNVGSIRFASGYTITMQGALTSTSDLDNAIELRVGAGGPRAFNNAFGVGALNATGGGNWIVYSNDPANDTKGGLVYNFKEYNTTVHSQGTGNGFVYAVNPAAITAATMTGGSISKVYDSSFSADLSAAVFSGVGIDGDLITLGGVGSGTFQDKNVGSGKLVDVDGLSLSGATNNGATVYGYSGSLGTFTVDTGVITPATLTFGLGVDNKTYDRTTTATPQFDGAPIFGVQGADALTINGATANFVDFNAGIGKQVNITGITLSGAAASNYTFSTTATTTANIDPAIVTSVAGVAASNKTYDGTTVASLNTAGATFTGVFAGDTLVVSGTGTFDSKNAGTGKTVALSGITLGGASVGNYLLDSSTLVNGVDISSANTTADIGKANITSISGFVVDNKVYDGNTNALVLAGPSTFTGKIFGDVLSIDSATAVFNNKNVGTSKAVTVSGFTLNGADAGNYNLLATAGTGTADITPKEITAVLGIGANNKIYDSTTVATLNTTLATFPDVIGGDVVAVTGTGTFINKNAASEKTVTIKSVVLGGADAGNYVLKGNGLLLVNGGLLANDLSFTTANIDKANITAVTGITASKVFDNTTSATTITTGANFTGMFAGDSLTVASSSATFQNVDAGLAQRLNVTGITLSGTDAGNYNLISSSAVSTGDIARVALTTWTGNAGDDLWSSPNNWTNNLAPTASNFERVSIPAPASNVQFTTAAGNVYLQSVDGNSLFSMSGGNLDIKGSLAASTFTQTGGTLSSLGTMTISGTISQTTGAIVSPDFSVSSVGGMSLKSPNNQISKIKASNSGGGDIVFENKALLSLMEMTNAGGNIDLNNIGGITVSRRVDASGNIKLTANSPLTVEASGGVAAGGNVSLIATNLTSTGNLTLDGPVNGNTVLLDAAGNMVINGEVVGTNGITAKAGGSLSFGVLSKLTGTPTTYSAGGFISDQRGGASQGGGATLTAFLDLFEKALDEQTSLAEETNPDGSKKKRGVDDTIVTEGETCRP